MAGQEHGARLLTLDLPGRVLFHFFKFCAAGGVCLAEKKTGGHRIEEFIIFCNGMAGWQWVARWVEALRWVYCCV